MSVHIGVDNGLCVHSVQLDEECPGCERIATFSEAELRRDLADSEADALMCERVNHAHFRDRISGNRQIIAAIRAELARRGLAS